jgi:hypothetical protein
MIPRMPPRPQEELPEYTVREYQPGDEQAILDTFNRSFADVDPTFEPRSMELWRWLYLANPSGWRIYIAITDDGRVISQYAGIRQRMLLEGQPAYFSQAIDSMTDPAFRRGLKKPGFFVITGYPYAANYGGPPPDGDVIMWGLPVPAAWRMGARFLKYEVVRTQNKLVADPAKLVHAAAPGVDVEEVERFPEDVELLTTHAASEHGAIAIRDKAQLDWRFPDHPERDYRIALARTNGEPAGFTVYRLGGYDGDEDALVCDWLVPGGTGSEGPVGAALLAWLAERARADSAERLTAVFPDTAAEWLSFQRAGFRVRPTRYFPVGRNYVPKYRMPWLHKHWYYTLGDSDLV